MDNPNVIISITLVARVINGLGSSSFLTPLYAYIPILFPEDVEHKIALAEILSALGFIVGPIVGSFLYALGGFLLPFIVFGTVSVVISILFLIRASSIK